MQVSFILIPLLDTVMEGILQPRQLMGPKQTTQITDVTSSWGTRTWLILVSCFVFERPIFTKDNGKIIAEVKELNKKLKNGNLTKEQIVAVKQDRRKLKNRKYSFNGRQVI